MDRWKRIGLGAGARRSGALGSPMSLLQSKPKGNTGRRAVIDLQKAERALKDGQHKEVEQLCQEVLEDSPDSLQACQILAELRLKERRFDEGMAWIERARRLEPHNPRSMNLLGRVLDHRGDLAAAEAAFRAAIERDADYPDALANLGSILLRTDRGGEAEQHFRRALRFDAEHGIANLLLGAILYAQRRPELAVPHLQTGIQRELTNRPGQYTLAVALHELGRLDEAITAYRRLIAAGDNDPEVFVRLASVLVITGELDSAMAGFETALEIQPGHPTAAAGLAEILTISWRAAEALEMVVPLMNRGDAPVCLHMAYTRALLALGRRDEALLHLADLVKRPLPPEALAQAHHLLGELLEARGEYDRAFAHHRHANRLRDGRYDPARMENFVTRLISSHTREVLDELPYGTASEAPVFIVGMPRTGATLIEHIIASHPRGAGAGAMPHIGLAAGRIGRYNNVNLPYPECTPMMQRRDLRELSAAYLARLFQEAERARRITDSMWLNFLHIGLIDVMFPKARIIDCRRNPLDNGLACFAHAFGEGGEPFAGDLAHIGHFYGQYRRLMAHWHATTRLPIHEIHYEALIQDPEAETRRLLEFLELPWSPDCLAFHENRRIVRSWNHEQLRHPLHQASVGRARRFDKYLGPLRDALAAAGHPAD